MEHFCNGTCGGSTAGNCTVEDCIDSMFASAIAIDILLSTVKNKPSLDDWFSCGYTCGRVSAGIMVHQIGPRTADKAILHWKALVDSLQLDYG